MEDRDFYNLAIALGLGLLIGLQREWAQKSLAGIRTYALTALLGTAAGLLAKPFGDWLPATGLLTLGVLVLVRGIDWRTNQEHRASGITTEIALMLTFVMGLMLAAGWRIGASCVAGAVLVLLQWKASLHGLVKQVGKDELQAIARLALIGLVILPLLPNESFGPYEVINPFQIWLMVVLIVGISLAAYLTSRLMGPRSGSIAAGLLGGLISSTATTVSSATDVKSKRLSAAASALVIMTASAVVFVRVAIELSVVAGGYLTSMLPPLLTLMAVMLCLTVPVFMRASAGETTEDRDKTGAPSGLRTAVVFGLLYAVVLLGVAAAREHLPREYLYVVAALSGLTDMDAITLSTGQLVTAGKLDATTGWRLIMVGGLANLVFKGAAVALLGTWPLLRWILFLFGATLVAGTALLFLWPG